MPSLSQQYRPQTFTQVQGQTSVVKALSNAITADSLSHAYLFTGPRGTGKTTMARLIAKAANCPERNNSPDPCGACTSCQEITKGYSMNVIEIDAASHTGVDNIRQIREEVHTPPTNAPYKIYIVDEVHMLSKGAFNALLKTLEEPPSHIIFILATTEVHKVPDTIISRCQRYDFSRIDTDHISEKLKMIASQEKVKVDESVFSLVALTAEGGMRDAESLFAQLLSLCDTKKTLSLEAAQEFLGLSDQQTVKTFGIALFTESASDLLTQIDEVVRSGHDIEIFTKRVILFLRTSLRASLHKREKCDIDAPTQTILRAIELLTTALNSMKTSFLPHLPLEIAAVKIAPNPETEDDRPQKIAPTQPTTGQTKSNPPKISSPDPATKPKQATPQSEVKPQETTTSKAQARKASPTSPVEFSLVTEHWDAFLLRVREQSLSLSLLFSNAVPLRTEGSTLVLTTKFAFHRDKLNDQATRLTGEDLLSTLCESSISLVCMTDEESGYQRAESKEEKEKPQPSEDILSNALESFGGTVVEGG